MKSEEKNYWGKRKKIWINWVNPSNLRSVSWKCDNKIEKRFNINELNFKKKRLIKKEKAKRKKPTGRKKLMKKKKKKSKSTGLNHQTLDPCHETLIIKQKKFNIKKL